MIKVAAEWNQDQALLKECLADSKRFSQAVEICLELHSRVHAGSLSSRQGTYFDLLWDGLSEEAFRKVVDRYSIAWHIWHLARIEDLCANLLIADRAPVFGADTKASLNITSTDTGNAMTEEEVRQFSASINMEELYQYRLHTGESTRAILKDLSADDIKRKVTVRQLERIREEGGVTDAKESRGLLAFWGRKTVAGLLMMPVTRHQVVHLNSCFKIKAKFLKDNG